LPNVGVVLVSALLIMPGAAARFWTNNLSRLLLLSGIFGFVTGFIGTMLSATLDRLPAGPIIVLTGSAIFLFSLLFGMRRGVIARLIEHFRFQRQLNEMRIAGGLPEVESV